MVTTTMMTKRKEGHESINGLCVKLIAVAFVLGLTSTLVYVNLGTCNVNVEVVVDSVSINSFDQDMRDIRDIQRLMKNMQNEDPNLENFLKDLNDIEYIVQNKCIVRFLPYQDIFGRTHSNVTTRTDVDTCRLRIRPGPFPMCYRHSSPRLLHIPRTDFSKGDCTLTNYGNDCRLTFTSFGIERLFLIFVCTSWSVLVLAILGVYLTTEVVQVVDGDVESPNTERNNKQK